MSGRATIRLDLTLDQVESIVDWGEHWMDTVESRHVDDADRDTLVIMTNAQDRLEALDLGPIDRDGMNMDKCDTLTGNPWADAVIVCVMIIAAAAVVITMMVRS